MEQQIQFCTTSDGVRIAYTASGQGPPVVRVLGWFTHLEYEWENPLWRSYIDGLSRRVRLIRYDGRGVGLSDRKVKDFSLEAFVLDLEAVIDALGTEKVALLGLSQGGPTAISYCVRHPERVSHLVAYGSWAHSWWAADTEEGKEHMAALVTLMRQGWGSDVPAYRQFFTSLFMPDADMDAIRQFNELQRVSASPESAAASFSSERHIDVRELLPQVRAPALVIHRRGDSIVPFDFGRELATGIPGARFLPLEGRNHALLPGEPEREIVFKAVGDFIGAGEEAALETHPVPSGVATVLFTDMESSTALTQRLGDAKAQELVRTHNTIVRDALKAHGGSEIKHTGDGIMASFPSASSALEGAVAIQRGVAARAEEQPEMPLGVRIGLNAGEPVAEEDDLFGASVQLARRICDHADPGQIVVSNVVRELATGKGFLFADRGDTALRGFEDPVRLYEVRWREKG